MDAFISELNKHGIEPSLVADEPKIWHLRIDEVVTAEASFAPNIEDNSAYLYVRDLSGSHPVDILVAESVDGEVFSTVHGEEVSLQEMAKEFAAQVESMDLLEKAI